MKTMSCMTEIRRKILSSDRLPSSSFPESDRSISTSATSSGAVTGASESMSLRLPSIALPYYGLLCDRFGNVASEERGNQRQAEFERNGHCSRSYYSAGAHDLML